MNIFKKVFKKHSITMYSDPLWTDCQEAKSFFADHNIHIKVKDIANPDVQNEMKKKFNRIMTPTIIIDRKVIIGFSENLEKIKQLLKINE